MQEILLTQGKVALVDDQDFDFLSQYVWHAIKCRNTYYAARMKRYENGVRRKIYLHTEVVTRANGASPLMVDHIDGDGLNNQRFNLRGCTATENNRNQSNYRGLRRSNYKGVYKTGNSWMVQITAGDERVVLRLREEVLAAKIYNTLAEHYHGEFARLNVID